MIMTIATWLIARNPALTLLHARRIAKVGVVAGAVVLAVIVAVWLNAREQADDKANQEIGAAIQREGDLRQVLERTEQANEVRSQIERDIQTDDGRSCAVYSQCLRTARTPANCQRFMPDNEADKCGTASE